MMMAPCILAVWPALVVWLVWTLIATAVSTGIAYLLRQKPKGNPAGSSAFNLPTATEGRPLPVVRGCRRYRGPNAISPIFNYHVEEKEKNHGASIALYYNVSLHMGICQANVDGVLQIWVADTCVWPVLNDPTARAADGVTTATIAAPYCFGGYEREGGVSGVVHIQYGGITQTLDSYLEAWLGADQPAYRGFTGVILADVYMGSVPQLKPLSFLVKATKKLVDGDAMWYIAKAPVGAYADFNAIHMIYEWITCPIIGMGKDPGLIGDTFATAAETCYDEGMGLSYAWDSAPDGIDDMIHQVEQIIDGKVYTDPATGKFEIGLIRQDYDLPLDIFDESDFWVESMPTSSPGTIPSRTVVLWHDRTTDQSRPAVADDIALLARQGGHPIVQELDYSAFVCDGDLANTIAARIQQQISAMPKRLTLHALRTMAHLHETSVIEIAYPELNIASMIVRVVTIDRGSLTEGECIIEVIEDVFGQAYTSYGTPPAAGAPAATETIESRILDNEGYSEIFYSTGAAYEYGPYASFSLVAPVALYRMESGALTTDSIGGNTLTNANVTADGTNHKQGLYSGLFARSSSAYMSRADSQMSSDFPFKAGTSNKDATVSIWFKCNSLPAWNDGDYEFADLLDSSVWIDQEGHQFAKGSFEISYYPNGDGSEYTIGCQTPFSYADDIGTPDYEGETYGRGMEIIANLYTGRWYHLCFAFNSTTKDSSYVLWDDNTASVIASGTTSQSGFTPAVHTGVYDCQFRLGAAGLLPPEEYGSIYFDGNLDEVAVFDYALTGEEMTAVREGYLDDL